MSDKKTLDLREEMMRRKIDSRLDSERQIEKIYNDGTNLKTINRADHPSHKKFFSGKILFLLILSAVILVFGFFYYQDSYKPKKAEQSNIWYSIKLVDGEIFYGQIEDISSDPVVMKNTYYNYDQIKAGEDISETGNIRLVKRGQETHGPTGDVNIIRSQILFVEPLGDDSKVLKAILDYEK